jgi:hypothetical protein
MSSDTATPITVGNIPADALQNMVSLAQQLLAAAQPYLKDLTAEQRRTIAKMGDKTTAFVDTMKVHMVANPQFAPKYVDLARFAANVDAIHALRTLHVIVVQLADLIDDTMLLLGSLAYTDALACYETTGRAAKRGEPMAEVIVKDAKPRWAKSPRTKSGGGPVESDAEAPADDAPGLPAFTE